MASEISQTGATLSGSYSGVTGTIVSAGFSYGLSSGALSSTITGTYNNGSISAKLSGLEPGTAYFYQAFLVVKGTGNKQGEEKTFYGVVRVFTSLDTVVNSLPTWLSSYEIPAVATASLTKDDTLYNGYYCHSTVSEVYGGTKAAVYNTTSSTQKVVVHTFEYNSKVQSNYSMLFDKNKKCALWVAYKYSKAAYPDKNVGRNDGWCYDPAIDESWQADLSGSYYSQNGLSYDRGHQVASNDRQTTVNQNKQTFYYSNMTPQYALLNQGRWAALESKIQGACTVSRDNQEMFIVTGPLFEGNIKYTYDASRSQCPIPTGYYKCMIRVTYDSQGNISGADGCAYIVETNSENTEPTLTSIDYVESKTGFNFFEGIPDTYENSAEAQSSVFWN